MVKTAGLVIEVTRTQSKDFPTKARRPANSALSHEKVAASGIEVRRYSDALKDYLAAKGYLRDQANRGVSH